MTATLITTPDQQRFERLFQRSRRRAYQLAYRLTGNAADAEDLTQDAYVCAWNDFARYEATRSFEGWLLRILINRAIDLHRRKMRVRFYSLDKPVYEDADESFIASKCADPTADPEVIVVASILEERLEAALSRLPADYRAALLLCAVEQHSYQEIAERMHCPLGTVRSHLYRARMQMRRYLETGDSAYAQRSADSFTTVRHCGVTCRLCQPAHTQDCHCQERMEGRNILRLNREEEGVRS